MPQIDRLVASTTFRQALAYMALFGVAFAIVIGVLYLSTIRLIEDQTANTVAAELRGLADQYREEGLGGLVEAVARRSGGDPDAVYLLAGAGGEPIVGNLTTWPGGAVPDGSWVRLQLFRESSGASSHTVGTRSFRLTSGHLLLVGRDFSAQQDFRDNLLGIFAIALAITVALGIAGGILMGRNLLRRVDAVNEASRRIMAGDLGERVPTDGSGDEFDRLAENLNRMLVRIEELLLGMRVVSESISHDLRSPLTRLRNRAELALYEAQPGDEAMLRQALEQTLTDTDGVLATFNALTEIAQAEAGTARTSLEMLDLAALVRDAGELYAPVAEDKKIAFIVEAAGELPIRGHAQLLSQALANLLDNAVKYTPAGGTIAVMAARDGDSVQLVIADSGPGIPAADRQRVLERFVRLDASRSEPGSGLGLSLVAAVAQLHDARLTLEDACPGADTPGLRVVWNFPAPGCGAVDCRTEIDVSQGMQIENMVNKKNVKRDHLSGGHENRPFQMWLFRHASMIAGFCRAPSSLGASAEYTNGQIQNFDASNRLTMDAIIGSKRRKSGRHGSSRLPTSIPPKPASWSKSPPKRQPRGWRRRRWASRTATMCRLATRRAPTS